MPGTCKALCHLGRKVEPLNLEEESYNHIITCYYLIFLAFLFN